MSAGCFRCGAPLPSEADGRIGRRDCCSRCGGDLHCCRNCKFHDVKAYNECREPQAERVLEKESSNFCDHFQVRTEGAGSGQANARDAALKKLDDLFK